MPRPSKTKSQKVKVDSNSADDSSGVCPVPFDICTGKDKSAEDPGVFMYCTNAACTIIKKPIHTCCFNKLEEKLIKSLNGNGRSRNWTKDQCRENLWGRKTRFIDKKLECKCKLGKLFRYKEQALNSTDSTQNAKTKKQKALPKLNTILSLPTPAARAKATAKVEKHFLADHSDDEMLAEPNPKKKVSTSRKKSRPVDSNNNNESSRSSTPSTLKNPGWLTEMIQVKTPSPQEASQRSKEVLEVMLTEKQQSKTASSASTCSELSSLSPKTSIDLGVGTSCSAVSSPDASFELELLDDPKYYTSDEGYQQFMILLAEIENKWTKLVIE